jgi:hypothetical protein
MKIKIVAHPNSKKSKIRKDLQDTIHIYVNEPPQKGKANKAIIEELAKFFDKPKASIKILHGHTSRSKLIEIL